MVVTVASTIYFGYVILDIAFVGDQVVRNRSIIYVTLLLYERGQKFSSLRFRVVLISEIITLLSQRNSFQKCH